MPPRPDDECDCSICEIAQARWEVKIYTRVAIPLIIVLLWLSCQYGH